MNAQTPEVSNAMVMGFKARGDFKATLRKADGSIEIFEKQNLVVDVGVDFICDAMAKSSSRPGVLSHIAIGTGTTAANAADTTLQTEVDRNAGTYAHTSGATAFTFEATFGAGEGTGNITEAGILNDASAGTLFNRVVFTAIPKEAGDSLVITFTITFTPA